MILKMIFNFQFPWSVRKVVTKIVPSASVSERLDRYVVNVSQPGAEPTQRERMDYRARVDTALDRL